MAESEHRPKAKHSEAWEAEKDEFYRIIAQITENEAQRRRLGEALISQLFKWDEIELAASLKEKRAKKQESATK